MTKPESMLEIAAMCHREKWQFEASPAFDVLHRIGDLARAAIPIPSEAFAKGEARAKAKLALSSFRFEGQPMSSMFSAEELGQIVDAVIELTQGPQVALADHVLMSVSDANNLDAVVHELDIEDSETTPAEAVRKLKAEIERCRASSSPDTGQIENERPLSALNSGDQPEWRHINDVFKRHNVAEPPWRLRDELVHILSWARYGEALDTVIAPTKETERTIAWLIERNEDVYPAKHPVWYVENATGWHDWTPVASAAKRFATRAEAEAFPAYKMIADDPDIDITEHVFMAVQS